jgi:hypothetical protein
MNKLIPILSSVLLGTALFGCASTSTPTRENTAGNGRPARLQLVVTVPPGMSIIRDDEIAEAFAYRVSSILHEQGFRGRIKYVFEGEKADPTVPILDIGLREWRVDRTGSVDCTFTASLNTPRGSQNLGIFTGTTLMTWSRPDWFARAEGFEDAARDAISDLAPKIQRSGLIE